MIWTWCATALRRDEPTLDVSCSIMSFCKIFVWTAGWTQQWQRTTAIPKLYKTLNASWYNNEKKRLISDWNRQVVESIHGELNCKMKKGENRLQQSSVRPGKSGVRKIISWRHRRPVGGRNTYRHEYAFTGWKPCSREGLTWKPQIFSPTPGHQPT